MHVRYTGKLARLRPFESVEECLELGNRLFIEPNQFWGSLWSPGLRRKNQFDEGGLLYPGGRNHFAIECLKTGMVVGSEEASLESPCGINAHIGTLILKEFQGRGLGIEAKLLALCHLFENYPIERVAALTPAIHRRAIRSLTACNMTLEGRYRRMVMSNGSCEDVFCFRIFREEWESTDYRQHVIRG